MTTANDANTHRRHVRNENDDADDADADDNAACANDDAEDTRCTNTFAAPVLYLLLISLLNFFLSSHLSELSSSAPSCC